MKKWFTILNGDSSESSAGITEEIMDVQKQLNALDIEISDAEKNFQEAMILSLGSGQGGKETEELGRQVSSLRDKRNTVQVILERLKKKYDQAVKREIDHEVSILDQEIKKLEAEKKKMQDEFMVLAGQAAGLWSLINVGSASFTAGPSSIPMHVGDFDSSPFKEACFKAINGRTRFYDLIHDLRLRKKALLAPPDPDMEA